MGADGIHPAVPRPVFDQHWSQTDEAQLALDWPVVKDNWKTPDSLPGVYRSLWALCLKFMICTPFDIVGVKTNFAFERKSVGLHGFAKDSRMFSMVFCKAMSPLITHSVWESTVPGEAAKNLTMALQYAVILRTNDQRPWKGIQPLDRFLRAFKRLADGQVGMVPIREQHAAARKACAKRYGTMAHVFRALEKHIKGAKKPVEGDQPYFIITRDLTDVAAALDDMHTPTGGAPYLSTGLIYAAVTEPKVHSNPPSKEQFPVWQDLAMQDQERWLRRQSNIAATGGEEASVAPGIGLTSRPAVQGFNPDEYADYIGYEAMDTDEEGEGEGEDVAMGYGPAGSEDGGDEDENEDEDMAMDHGLTSSGDDSSGDKDGDEDEDMAMGHGFAISLDEDESSFADFSDESSFAGFSDRDEPVETGDVSMGVETNEDSGDVSMGVETNEDCGAYDLFIDISGDEASSADSSDRANLGFLLLEIQLG
ncbi:hypothetical protein AK830_g12245 [Neonectria ditissima]|uniref:Uncharacterized protein n=1 Tax=Neonectria ditissima TaxID=78410 RepID=A0A0P7B0Z6_9HYPO|nr:hypothetical protein AK830_g12245 [Neonectria ditissima]